jgi:uncharacterized membrane protein
MTNAEHYRAPEAPTIQPLAAERFKRTAMAHPTAVGGLRRDVVEYAREIGASSTQDIAEALGFSRSTLWRQYSDQLRRNNRAS